MLIFGSGSVVIAAAQASFFTGREQTRVVMFVDTTATVLNAALDYLWIFGRCGFPAGGITGAAWATVTAEWFRVLVYALVMLRPATRGTYQLTVSGGPTGN